MECLGIFVFAYPLDDFASSVPAAVIPDNEQLLSWVNLPQLVKQP